MLVVVSPHLDDAVFGCTDALAAHPGSCVVTLFAGVPRRPEQTTGWDAACGFHDAADAAATRRREDRQALSLLDARALWLDFCDSQYGEPAEPERLKAAIARVLAELRPDCVLFPLGLYHSDHLLTHDACIAALREAGADAPQALAYEDALYRSIDGVLQQRLVDLARAGIRATPAAAPGVVAAAPQQLKREAVHAYASQLRAFGDGGFDDLWRPERLWRLDAAASAPQR